MSGLSQSWATFSSSSRKLSWIPSWRRASRRESPRGQDFKTKQIVNFLFCLFSVIHSYWISMRKAVNARQSWSLTPLAVPSNRLLSSFSDKRVVVSSVNRLRKDVVRTDASLDNCLLVIRECKKRSREWIYGSFLQCFKWKRLKSFWDILYFRTQLCISAPILIRPS